MAIPHISHASWLLGRLYQVPDIRCSRVGCAGLLWHVLNTGRLGFVVADFHRRGRPGLDVLHHVGIEIFDGFQDRCHEGVAGLPAFGSGVSRQRDGEGSQFPGGVADGELRCLAQFCECPDRAFAALADSNRLDADLAFAIAQLAQQPVQPCRGSSRVRRVDGHRAADPACSQVGR